MLTERATLCTRCMGLGRYMGGPGFFGLRCLECGGDGIVMSAKKFVYRRKPSLSPGDTVSVSGPQYDLGEATLVTLYESGAYALVRPKDPKMGGEQVVPGAWLRPAPKKVAPSY